MPFAIKLTDVADDVSQPVSFVRLRNPWPGNCLQIYDPDAHAGFGEATFGPEPELAIPFASFDDAKACWWQQSSVLPVREGRENRPLTICSIEIAEVS